MLCLLLLLLLYIVFALDVAVVVMAVVALVDVVVVVVAVGWNLLITSYTYVWGKKNMFCARNLFQSWDKQPNPTTQNKLPGQIAIKL